MVMSEHVTRVDVAPMLICCVGFIQTPESKFTLTDKKIIVFCWFIQSVVQKQLYPKEEPQLSLYRTVPGLIPVTCTFLKRLSATSTCSLIESSV